MNQETYPKEELEASLRRAFIDGEADFIIMDGHAMRSRFLREGVAYGVEQGWLKRGRDIDEDRIYGEGLGQYLAFTYRLTSRGKKHLVRRQ